MADPIKSSEDEIFTSFHEQFSENQNHDSNKNEWGVVFLSQQGRFSRNIRFCIFWIFAKINYLIFRRSRI